MSVLEESSFEQYHPQNRNNKVSPALQGRFRGDKHWKIVCSFERKSKPKTKKQFYFWRITAILAAAPLSAAVAAATIGNKRYYFLLCVTLCQSNLSSDFVSSFHCPSCRPSRVILPIAARRRRKVG